MPASTKGVSRKNGHHVVCAVDSQMVYGLSVMMSSLVDHARSQFRITIGYLDGRLSDNDREFLSQLSEKLGIPVNFLSLPNKDVFITQGHISPTTFAKFLLGDEIPSPHLWMDADTVALAGWDEIFATIEASGEKEGLVVAERGSSSRTHQFKPSDLPFNAGVLGWPAAKRRDWETPLASLPLVDTQEQYLFNQLYAETAARVSEKFNMLTYRIDTLDSENLPHIIHYAGAHKPWHMRRDLVPSCEKHQCPWSPWFEAERAMLEKLKGTSLGKKVAEYQHNALVSGKIRWRRDHSGYNMLRFLTVLGPLASAAVRLLGNLKQWVPRGTHPIH